MAKPALGSKLDPNHPLSLGLIGAFAINEGEGTKVGDQATGNPAEGTLSGTTIPTWSGVNDQGLRFAGGAHLASYVTFGAPSALNNLFGVTGALLSGSIYIKGRMGATNTAGGLVGKNDDNAGTQGWQILLAAGPTIQFSNEATANLTGSIVAPAANTDFDLLITYDGTLPGGTANLKAYLNGAAVTVTILAAGATPKTTDAASPLRFGTTTGFAAAGSFDGDMYEVLIWGNRILSSGEAATLNADPYAMFVPNYDAAKRQITKPRTLFCRPLGPGNPLREIKYDSVIDTGVADTPLVVDDATIALAADNVDLTQDNTLAVNDATVALSTDAIALVQANTLVVTDAAIALAADSVALTQQNTLAVADATVALAADSVALTQANVLAVADALIALGAENVTLDAGLQLDVIDALIALVADSPSLVDVTEPAPAPGQGGAGIGGGTFPMSRERRRRAERAVDKALEEQEKKRKPQRRRAAPKEEEPEPAGRSVRVLAPAPEGPEAPPPIERKSGRGETPTYRLEPKWATLSPRSGSHGRAPTWRRQARYAQTEPRGIQNPTLEEIYLTTVLT